MLSKGTRTRNLQRQSFNHKKTNIKVKKPLKPTRVPYNTTNSAIDITEQVKKQMTTQSKEVDSKFYDKVSVQIQRCSELENSLRNNKQSDEKLHNDSYTIKMDLRKRRIKDYKDLLSDSLEIDNQQTNEVHVPIYLQKNKAKESTKRNDPFEFIIERQKKSKKDDNTDSDSSTFDKTMQEVLKEIENKEKKSKTLRKKILNKNQKLAKTNNLEKANTLNVNEKQADKNVATSTPIVNVINNDLSLHSQSPSKQINIISNLVIRPSENPASSVCSLDDNYADITDFDHQPYTTPSTPWRGDDLHLRRNPHWLALKNTSLPFYNQEMILQPELLEKSETNKSIQKENSYVQTRISDFITCAEETCLDVNNRSCLFDEQRFSPIKTKEKRKTKTPMKTNNILSPIKNKDMSNAMKVKRNIFSLLDNNRVDNVQNVSNNYSFSFMDDENKENSPRQFKNKKKNPSALPMRVSITDLKKVQKDVVEGLLEDIVINESLNQSLPVAETSETNAPVGLFEDLEPPPVMERTYASKRRRRVRIESVEEEEKPKKKKKDNRTKAEKEAFRKWAASFNAMCEEVEQHHLEIEPI